MGGNKQLIFLFFFILTGTLLDLTLKRMHEPTERLALHINSWQVNANIFKVMLNAFFRDFYFSL